MPPPPQRGGGNPNTTMKAIPPVLMPTQKKRRSVAASASLQAELIIRERLGDFFARCGQADSCFCSIVRHEDARFRRQLLPRVLIFPRESGLPGLRLALLGGVGIEEIDTLAAVVSVTEYFLALPHRLGGSVLTVYPLVWSGHSRRHPEDSLARTEIEGHAFDLIVTARIHAERGSEVIVRGKLWNWPSANDEATPLPVDRDYRREVRTGTVITPTGAESPPHGPTPQLEIFLPRGWPAELHAAILRGILFDLISGQPER
jgi:hypothetical protein